MATLTLDALNRKATAIYGADDTRYRLLVLKRIVHDGEQLHPGVMRLMPSLRTAAAWCAGGVARPADRRTQIDTELFTLLQRTRGRGESCKHAYREPASALHFSAN